MNETPNTRDPVTDWLDQAQARSDAATEGPWTADGLAGNLDSPTGRVAEVGMWSEADAEFIAAARADLPAAIAALREALRYLDDPNERLMGHSSPAVYVEPLRHAIATALGVTAPQCSSCGHELQQAVHSAPGYEGVEYALCPACGWQAEP